MNFYTYLREATKRENSAGILLLAYELHYVIGLKSYENDAQLPVTTYER